jgi:hypothetical protein
VDQHPFTIQQLIPYTSAMVKVLLHKLSPSIKPYRTQVLVSKSRDILTVGIFRTTIVALVRVARIH